MGHHNVKRKPQLPRTTLCYFIIHSTGQLFSGLGDETGAPVARLCKNTEDAVGFAYKIEATNRLRRLGSQWRVVHRDDINTTRSTLTRGARRATLACGPSYGTGQV